MKPVISKAATSREFMREHFANKTYHDTVYVTANANLEREDVLDGGQDIFHTIIKTFADYGERGENIHPKTIFENAIDAHKRFPDKRLIIHFMQPHTPYYGDYADNLRSKLQKEHNIEFTKIKKSEKRPKNKNSEELSHLGEAVSQGYLPPEEHRMIYKRNLDFVLDYVEKLINEIDGKSVITADHGELLHDRKAKTIRTNYGHPPSLYSKQLRQVPWLEIESGNRRNIVSEKPIEIENVDEKKINENLEALGYL